MQNTHNEAEMSFKIVLTTITISLIPRPSPSFLSLAVRGSQALPSLAVRGSQALPSLAVRGSQALPLLAIQGSQALPLLAVRGSQALPSLAAPVPVLKLSKGLGTLHHNFNNTYHIVENFCGRKFSQTACWCCQKMPHPHILQKKLL